MDAEQWDQRYAQSEFLWTAEPNRFLVQEVESLPPGKALDLAAGEGRNAVWLATLGWDVLGVDFSKVALDKARRLADARGVQVRFDLADVRTYRPKYRGYDLVIVMYLQIPWEDLVPVLRRAAGAVAPGGTFLLVAHDRDNIERGYGGPSDPGVLYSADQVAAELEGLTIERAVQVERTVSTDQGEAVAIDCLVRAHLPAGARRT